MSNADPLYKQVGEFIEDYLREELSVSGMQRLHEEYFSETVDFLKWKDVIQEYTLKKEWSNKEFQRFVQYAKQFVAQDQRTVSEVYLTSPEVGGVLHANPDRLADQHPYSPDDDDDDGSGFVPLHNSNRQNRGLYIHVQNQISVRYSGDIERYTQESVIPFKYDSKLDILIAESTYPPDVQRLKSAFDRNTQYGVETFCANLRKPQFGPVEVCQRMNDISIVSDVELTHIDVEFIGQTVIQEFSSDYNPPNSPELLRESDFSTENFGGKTKIRSAEAKVIIEDEVYDFKISSGDRMFYTQFMNPPKRKTAKQLLNQIRYEVIQIFEEGRK
ncbi:hypothetical protein [Haloarchaeobius sp. HME9146]|uniref:hypothetical protein n=1 Tax=Haloarchaeobius sp. HME9146 TaxID=2978732 RepID=UPI0021BE4A23|nr:hypothetical protein [Haloarchaeobius sp. HME9146]MCT9096337.1 hypothetical protein [Haloarchaeobius sp. HME9146]